MVEHGGSSVGSYLADPTSPIPSHCASIVVTSTVRVKVWVLRGMNQYNVEVPNFTENMNWYTLAYLNLQKAGIHTNLGVLGFAEKKWFVSVMKFQA